MLAGIWGLNNQGYLNGNFIQSRTPLIGTGQTDVSYQFAVGAGYTFGTTAFDLGGLGGISPLSQITTKSGYFGVTYAQIADSVDPDSQREDQLLLLHQQLYARSDRQQALFWVRMGFLGSVMTSGLIQGPDNRAKETAFTLDAYYPASPELLLGAGLGFYGYDNQSYQFFADAQKDQSTYNQYMLGATVQGLPHTTASINGSWQIIPHDIFVPRYTATEVDSTRQWTHTLDLGWRHEFDKSFSFTPTYEATMQSGLVYTGFLIDLAYTL